MVKKFKKKTGRGIMRKVRKGGRYGKKANKIVDLDQDKRIKKLEKLTKNININYSILTPGYLIGFDDGGGELPNYIKPNLNNVSLINGVWDNRQCYISHIISPDIRLANHRSGPVVNGGYDAVPLLEDSNKCFLGQHIFNASYQWGWKETFSSVDMKYTNSILTNFVKIRYFIVLTRQMLLSGVRNISQLLPLPGTTYKHQLETMNRSLAAAGAQTYDKNAHQFKVLYDHTFTLRPRTTTTERQNVGLTNLPAYSYKSIQLDIERQMSIQKIAKYIVYDEALNGVPDSWQVFAVMKFENYEKSEIINNIQFPSTDIPDCEIIWNTRSNVYVCK